MNIKEGDVFNFSYKPGAGGCYPYWTMDGQLVAKKTGDELVLIDTYWGDDSGRHFTIAEAESKGQLTFRFNLADVVNIEKWQTDFYDESDWFDFSSQHGCYKRFVLKKGAVRSQAAMLENISEKIRRAESDAQSAADRAKYLSEIKAKIEAGDTTVSFS